MSLPCFPFVLPSHPTWFLKTVTSNNFYASMYTLANVMLWCHIVGLYPIHSGRRSEWHGFLTRSKFPPIVCWTLLL